MRRFARATGSSGRSRVGAGEWRWLAVPAGVGVGLGLLWRPAAALARDRSSVAEAMIAEDGALALLLIVAAVVTSAVLLLRPGARPTLRAGLTLAGAQLGGLLAWGTGQLIGAPALHALGVALLWPLLTAAALTVRGLFAMVIFPEERERGGRLSSPDGSARPSPRR